LLTKHRVFSGPGFQVAVEVGDAANGGQVLLTHDAWLKLEAEMALAGFPTVKQIGLYQLQSWPTPIWLYEASALPTSHLNYNFQPTSPCVPCLNWRDFFVCPLICCVLKILCALSLTALRGAQTGM
jgi:hypothetical protein